MRALEARDELVDVIGRDGRVAEVPESNVPGLDVFVKTTGDDNVAGPEGADKCGRRDAVRDVDGRHAVCGRVRVDGDVLEAEGESSRLELGTLVPVDLVSLLEGDGALRDDFERRLKGVNQVLQHSLVSE